ncbi:hypothetical protein Lfu02_66870 [Longispora fulva]|uniref:Putative Tic20 family protein n=1 Tax=Longispora fulva TaxID=619741 RepID=A0A8J7GJB8_9ACTN|nr:DUF4870 domain-containing protein [Longispora fulva]MBG6138580.1 putative Tic20 family protein [Longispora fulva]GIG62315.1 hypothetical protein Lfu02_66870 [Longispora fulva]
MTQPPPPGYGYPPPPPANSDDKTWALVATFGAAVGAFISCGVLGFAGPLVAYLAKGKESAAVRSTSLAALNFHAPLSVAAFVLGIIEQCGGRVPYVGWLVSILAGLVALVVFVGQIVFGIIAGMKANEGQPYSYPFNFNFIK